MRILNHITLDARKYNGVFISIFPCKKTIFTEVKAGSKAIFRFLWTLCNLKESHKFILKKKKYPLNWKRRDKTKLSKYFTRTVFKRLLVVAVRLNVIVKNGI